MERVFWHSDFGFVAEGSASDSAFPGGESYEVLPFAERLLSSKRLPDLSGAPVASWLLARLFALTHGHMLRDPFSDFSSHLAGYLISFAAFTQQLQPTAFLHICGLTDMVTLQANTPEGTKAYDVIHGFYSALLAQPQELRPCKWTVTAPEQTVSFGWSGTHFLQ